MSQQSYLIDTNILIGLEDYHAVEASYARFHALASAHKVDIYVHEAAKDDIARDKDVERRQISISKIAKYRTLKKTARSDRSGTCYSLRSAKEAQ